MVVVIIIIIISSSSSSTTSTITICITISITINSFYDCQSELPILSAPLRRSGTWRRRGSSLCGARIRILRASNIQCFCCFMGKQVNNNGRCNEC